VDWPDWLNILHFSINFFDFFAMMKILKYFFSIVLYTYGGIIFIFMLLWLIFVSSILKPEVWDPWFKAMLRFLFRILFVKVEVVGTENMQKGKAYIFMPNHVSFLDVPLVAGFIPVFFRGVEAHNHFKWPLYGWATRSYGNIPINRKNAGKSMHSYSQLKKYVSENKSVLIFPESTRTKTGEMGKFKKLPFFIAKQTTADIIPVSISGMYGLNADSGLLVDVSVPITIRFGKAISQETIQKSTPEELARLTEQHVRELTDRP
jgi:1-acyl-sn-glycerol-3-phosphate acyltransferase